MMDYYEEDTRQKERWIDEDESFPLLILFVIMKVGLLRMCVFISSS
jgi:hypothetical protein